MGFHSKISSLRIFGLTTGLRWGLTNGRILGLATGCIFGLTTGRIFGLTTGRILGLTTGRIFGLITGQLEAGGAVLSGVEGHHEPHQDHQTPLASFFAGHPQYLHTKP